MKHERLRVIRSSPQAAPAPQGVRAQVAELQRRLDCLHAALDHAAPSEAVDDIALARKVRSIQKARVDRSRLFSAELFADPAWDILLDLFASGLEQRRVSITGLCSASNVPQSTALRWIGVLEKHDLIMRREDPLDARRIFIMLSAQGFAAMKEYFCGLSPAANPL